MFILILILVYQVHSQFSTSPTWIGNPYLQTDSYQVITDFQTVSQSGAANITFGQVYSVPPQIAFGIITYSGTLKTYLGNDGLFDEDFFMRTVRVTQTLAQLYIFMQGATNIRILYVMYLAVHPDFLYHLNSFNDIEANYSTNGALSLSPINTYTSQVRIFTNYINYTQLCERINARHKYFGSDLTKNKIAVYLSGIFNYVSGKDLPEIKFDILTEAVNASFFKLEITVSPTYQIDLLRLSFISMDIANIETSKQYTIVYKTQRYYFDQDYFIPLEKEFFGDVFIGMLDFNTQSPRCTIDFNLIFEPQNSRIIVKKSVPHQGSLFPGCGLKSARLVTFYMKTWYCPDPFYYFNLQTDMCDDYCASYFYGNKTAGQCRPCPTGCVRCDPLNPDTCTHCDSLKDFRELINGKCECMEGFYQQVSSDVICTQCEVVVGQCSKCSFISNFNCEECKIGWYLDSNGLCQQCNISGCIDCITSSQCVFCDVSSNYTLLSNKTCSQCPISCLCDGYYLPKIFDSVTGNQYCSTVCGDGLMRENEKCDDGNKFDGDGCNSKCQIQSYWSCHNSGQELTCCVIKQQEMYLRVNSIIKSRGQNAFEMNLSLYPYLPFLSSQKLKSSLSITLTGIAIDKQQVTVEETQKIRLKYFYNEHVQKKECNITLKISLKQDSNQNCSMQVQTSMKFYPQSSNNQPLMFFDPQNYQKQQTTNQLIKLLIYASYGILALSALPCKIVGLQLFGVLQIAYFSLAEINNLNLMMVPFVQFSEANGFNTNFMNSQNKLPEKIKSIEYDSSFMNNCGVMLGLMLVQVFVGMVLFMISFFISKTMWISNVSKRLLKQGFLTLLIFNSFNFAFGTGIHFRYSDFTQQYFLINSILSVLSLVAPIIMVLALIFTQSRQFGQFKDKFKKQKVSQLYFVVTILYRYFLGYFMAVKSENQLGSLVVIMFSLLFILYNFVNLPFKSAMHNYRANICHLSQLGILVVANYYESMKATTEDEIKSMIFTPAYFEIGLIILTIFFSFMGLLFQLYMFIKGFKSNKIRNEINQKSQNFQSFQINENYLDQASKNKLKDFNQTIENQEILVSNKIQNSIENQLYFTQD